MSLLGWIVFGLIAGFAASRVVSSHGEGCILNIVRGITGFDLYSMFVAVVGAGQSASVFVCRAFGAENRMHFS